MGGLWHLTKRFVSSAMPGPPDPEDDAWARRQLLPGEAAIWDRMSNPDRRHAVDVARAVSAALEPAEREVLAAALLHDCGKVESGLRTPARVVATVVWAVAGHDTARRWADAPATTVRGRFGRYRRHPELGAELLQQAGSASVTVRWTAEHHRPEPEWTVPMAVGRVLHDCDND